MVKPAFFMAKPPKQNLRLQPAFLCSQDQGRSLDNVAGQPLAAWKMPYENGGCNWTMMGKWCDNSPIYGWCPYMTISIADFSYEWRFECEKHKHKWLYQWHMNSSKPCFFHRRGKTPVIDFSVAINGGLGQQTWGWDIFMGHIPSGYVKIAIENGRRNSEFSHEKW